MSDTDQYTDVPVEPAPDEKRRRVPRWVTYVVLGLIVLVVLFFGAIFIYAKVINDSPAEFTAGDLDAALSSHALSSQDGHPSQRRARWRQVSLPCRPRHQRRARFDRRCHRSRE